MFRLLLTPLLFVNPTRIPGLATCSSDFEMAFSLKISALAALVPDRLTTLPVVSVGYPIRTWFAKCWLFSEALL